MKEGTSAGFLLHTGHLDSSRWPVCQGQVVRVLPQQHPPIPYHHKGRTPARSGWPYPVTDDQNRLVESLAQRLRLAFELTQAPQPVVEGLANRAASASLISQRSPMNALTPASQNPAPSLPVRSVARRVAPYDRH